MEDVLFYLVVLCCIYLGGISGSIVGLLTKGRDIDEALAGGLVWPITLYRALDTKWRRYQRRKERERSEDED